MKVYNLKSITNLQVIHYTSLHFLAAILLPTLAIPITTPKQGCLHETGSLWLNVIYPRFFFCNQFDQNRP